MMRSYVAIRIYWFIWFACIRGRDATQDIIIKCISCEGMQFDGVVGKSLIVQYTIKQNVRDFIITYNKTNKIYILGDGEEGTFNYIVDLRDLQDKGGRFVIPQKLSKDGKSKSIIITLTKLSLNDNGAEFTYMYNAKVGGSKFRRDIKWPTRVLTVTVAEKTGFDTTILIVVLVCIVLLISAIVGMLFKKQILPTVFCLEVCCNDNKTKKERKKKEEETGESTPFGKHDYDEKLYDEPHTQNQENISNVQPKTEYAVLGSGGGRVGERNEKPQKSMYAQAKTEDVNYPDINYAEPRTVNM